MRGQEEQDQSRADIILQGHQPADNEQDNTLRLDFLSCDTSLVFHSLKGSKMASDSTRPWGKAIFHDALMKTVLR